MGITRKRELEIDVLTAAKQRVINAFSNGVKVYCGISGGKDSIVMMDIVYNLIQEGKIDPSLLECFFIDEEAMYEDVIEIAQKWRKKFLMVGAKFSWYCLEVRHYNCLRNLEDDESFICWDRYQRENWCRKMPPYAIASHPLLRPRVDRYQEFTARLCADGINMVGVRVAESVQRRKYISTVLNNNSVTNNNLFYPIYDMADSDIWLYIKEHGVDYPRVYEEMYAVGMSRRSLRVCNYLAIDTIGVLSKLYEFRPALAEAIQRREPNAYMAQMYWDTEMFHRHTRKRQKLEEGQEDKDYKALTLEMCAHPDKFTTNAHKKQVIMAYKKAIIKMCGQIPDKQWRQIYEALIAGDTKTRTLRAIMTQITSGRGNSK